MHQAPAGHARHCTGKGRRFKDVPLPVLADAPGRAAPEFRPSRRGKWRAATLLGVHALIAAHIAHWLIAGRTVSPVEPSESMYTLEKGELNAGFIFFCVAIVSTLVFGRFFCGWGCHIVALQDLCGWMMKKCGVRPRPFRSRLLVYVPLLLALYMFVWPTVKRELVAPFVRSVRPDLMYLLGAVQPRPALSNHLLVTDFWATFASVAVAIPFLLVCGFAAVYFLGAKGFCTYGCPYGGIFGPVDAISPGKIIVDDSKCEHCGHCTAACTSNVRVHEEIAAYGMVVNPGCMKCMDCVSVCPNGALRWGFTRPAIFKRRARAARPRRVYDLTWREEVLLALFFALVFFAARGAWGVVPMLFAVGIAGCVTFVVWKAWRTLRDRDVRLHSFQLTRRGRVTGAGWACVAAGALGIGAAGALGGVKGAVKWHALAGDAHDYAVTTPAAVVFSGDFLRVDQKDRESAARALDAYERALGWARWGTTPADESKIGERIAWLRLVRGEPAAAERALRGLLDRQGPNDALIVNLSRVSRLADGDAEAEALLARASAEHPEFPGVRRELASIYARTGRADLAQGLYEDAIVADPHDAEAMAILASVLLGRGETDRAQDLLRRAVEERPRDPALRSDLAVALFIGGRPEEAVREMEASAGLAKGDALVRRRLAQMLSEMGRAEEAERWNREADRLEAEATSRGAGGGR